MDAKQFFTRALEQATEVIDQTSEADFPHSTPDTDWDVRTLVAHMLYELSWVSDILGGKTIEEIGAKYDGDLIQNDLQNNWQQAAERAHHALGKVDMAAIVHLSFGEVPAEDYLWQIGTDLLIHAWDLGEGILQPVNFNTEEAQAAYEYLHDNADDWQSSGLFAAPVEVPNDASLQTKLLALSGRTTGQD